MIIKNSFNLLAIVLLLCIGQYANAQVDRTQVPQAGEPTEFKMGKYKTFTLKNGLQVIVVQNTKVPRVTFQLIVERPPIKAGNKAGYIDIAGQMLSAGTKTLSKEKFDEEVDFLGANFSTSSKSIYISGLSRNKEDMFNLFADAIKNPAFPAEELEKIKTQTLSGIKASKDNADAISANLINAKVYGSEHPYGEVSTEETIANISLEDCKEYYGKYFVPNSSYLIAVGDISKGDIKKLAKKHFSNWNTGTLPQSSLTVPIIPQKNEVAIANKAGAVQSVIKIGYPLNYKPASEDAARLTLLNQVLGGGSFSARLVQNIREDKAYTYSAYSRISSDEYVGSFVAGASVRTEVTDSAITEFLYEMNRLLTEDISDEELEIAKNNIIGSFARSVESPQTVARFALNMSRYNLPSDYYEKYLVTIKNITAAELREVAKKYIKPENCYITVVGNARAVGKKLAKFGTVKYYDNYGLETEAPKAELPKGLTAEKVFENYINAIGGREKIEAIKTFKIIYEAKAAFGTIEIEQIASNNSKLYLLVKMNGNPVQTTIINGDKGIVQAMGKESEIPKEQIASMKFQMNFCEELAYLTDKTVSYKLIGPDEINNKDAVAVEVDFGSGIKSTRLYDLKTGLLLGIRSTNQGVTMENGYADYKEFDGILVPKVQSNSQLPASLNLKSADFNIKVDPKTFKI